MRDKDKTKKQLIAELVEPRQRVAESEVLKKHFESSEDAFRLLVENSLQGLVIVQDFRIVFANTAFAEISGYTIDELFSRSPEEVKAIVHPEDQEFVWKRYLDRLHGKHVPTHYEYRGVKKDGTVCWLEMFATRIDYRRKPAVQGAVIDITERKQAEEALRESEEKYRSVVERANDGVAIIQDGILTYVNPSLAQMTGYTVDESIGVPFVEFIYPDELSQALEYYKRRMAGKNVPRRYERSLLHKDGRRVHTEINGAVITYQNKPADLAIIRDITNRNRAEEALRENEERYRSLLESSEDSIYLVDKECKYLFMNNKYLSRLDVQIDQVVGKAYREFHTPEGAKDFEKKVKGVFKTGHWLSYEYRSQRDKRYFIRTLSPVKDPDTGKPTAVTVISKDITDYKLAEEALRASESRFRTLFEAIPDSVLVHDNEGDIIHVNDVGAKRLEWSVEDLVGKNLREIVTSENIGSITDHIREAHTSGMCRFETTYVSRTGRQTIAEVNECPIEFGGKSAILSVARDITERKQADEALRESEERFRKFADEATFEGIIFHDGKKILDVNKTFATMYGYERDELIGMDPLETIEPECRDIVSKYMQSGYEKPYETIALKKDGSTFINEIRAKTIPFHGRMVRGAAVRDITERKRAEEELREEALIYENIHDGIIVTDLEGTIIRWNPAAEKMFGYFKNDVVRKTVGVLTTKIIKGTLRDGRWSGEMNFTRKDGTEGICETIVIPLLDEHGTITSVFGVSRDITDRKRAEEGLQEGFYKLQRVLEGTVGALALAVEMRDPYTAGHQRRVASLADAIAGELGLSGHQIEGLRLAGLIHDLGKINIPAEILSKPGLIKELEFSIIKIHPQVGYEILKEVVFPWPVAQIVLQHHERMDGSGYPQGIRGEEILVEARILAVADVVEAMASHRPYRPAHGIDKALDEIITNRGVLYDPKVVDACIRNFREKGFLFK